MKLAIIGGSLFPELKVQQQLLAPLLEETITTPYGETSDTYTTGKIKNLEVVYLNRHGRSHQLSPHHINYKANMFALKLLEVTDIIAVAAVGGITEKMSPMKCVIADQLVDYTHGRIQTYNDVKDDAVKHIDFSYPFDENLRSQLNEAAAMCSIKTEMKATYGVTQGPRLETVAEILRMQGDGCDIVGMTAMPEAAMARELEMNYANLSLVVNWAAGKSDKPDSVTAEIISMDEIRQRITEGNTIIENIVHQLLMLLTK